MKRMILAVIGIFMGLFLTAQAQAVNFADGYHLKGPWLGIYPFWYGADTLTDKNSAPLTKEFNLDKYGALIRPLYYTDNFVFNAIIPVGKLDIGLMHDDDTGVGDVILGAGYFLPIDWASILPVLQVKTPTGSYDRNARVNFGDGQTDLMLETYVTKFFENKISFDAAFKYWIRFKENGVDPGNEFYAEGLGTYEVVKALRIGPSIKYMVGEKDKEKISLGGEIIYQFNPKFQVLLNVMNDVHSHNQPEGTLVMSRIAIGF